MKKLVLMCLGSIVLFGGCSFFSLDDGDDEMRVVCSVLPQKTLIERITGDIVDVEVLVKPGYSPSTYDITSSQLSHISKSDIFFRIGVPFEESWLPKIRSTAPKLAIVDVRQGIPLRLMGSGGNIDPHIWLSPRLAIKQAKTIKDALSQRFPHHIDTFYDNYQTLLTELEQLDEDIRDILGKIPNRHFLVYHPAWGYFADEYGLEQLAIEHEGKNLTPGRLNDIITIARTHNIKTIFVQKQFSPSSAETIAKDIGAQVVQVDPLSSDYFTELRRVAKIFQENSIGSTSP